MPGISRAILLLVVLAVAGGATAQPPIVFTDMTEHSGLSKYLAGWVLAHGAAWGDADGDGRPDLYIGAFADRKVPYHQPDAPIPNQLFLATPDGFIRQDDPVIQFNGVHARTTAALFVDLNNDGKLDLVVSNHVHEDRTVLSKVFENLGGGRFRDVTPVTGDWMGGSATRNISAYDFNHDGLLDLVFAEGTYNRKPGRHLIVLENNGNFTFREVAAKYGLDLETREQLGLAIGDVNNDGIFDFFIAGANCLMVSRPDGTYHEVQRGFVPRPRSRGAFPCGAAFGDLNGDGLLDLVTTEHGQGSYDHVFLNQGITDGDPAFVEISNEAGLGGIFPRVGITDAPLKNAFVALQDVDNDGRLDIMLGIIYQGADGNAQPVVLRNLGNTDGIPRFTAPPYEQMIGYYAAAPVADYDRDGRLDWFLAPWFDETPPFLFRNTTDGGNWLAVRVEGKGPGLNPMGIGAVVRAYRAGAAGRPEALLARADIAVGNGYSSGDEAIAHLGLGKAEEVDLVITWDKMTVVREKVKMNELLTVSMSRAGAPLAYDLSGPEYNPPDCPAWARETLPAWTASYVGKNGAPDGYRANPKPFGSSTRGLDRYQANQFIWYRPETAAYLYRDYTPLTVGYVPGTLPTFEKVAAQYTAGCATDTEKAVALLCKAMPAVLRHPTMPPCGPPVKADRNLDDEELLKTGGGWCNEQARVFIRLCQVSGIPARMIHIFGQDHTIAEFYADGRWALADASNFFVVPGADGKLLSTADCHDRGTGQRSYALAKGQRMKELAALPDAELNLGTPEQAARFREKALNFDAEALAVNDKLAFGIINYPLPPRP
jgi:hypothetical protein